MKRSFHAIMLAAGLAFGLSTVASDELPVAPFQAHYEVYGQGLSLGEAVMSLAADGSGGY